MTDPGKLVPLTPLQAMRKALETIDAWAQTGEWTPGRSAARGRLLAEIWMAGIREQVAKR